MLDLFRIILLTALFVLFVLLSPIESNFDFDAKIESIAFARAIDLYHASEGSCSRGETSNDGTTKTTSQDAFFETASTLEEVWSDLKLLVPNRGSNGYFPPELLVIQDFERIVLDMLTIGHGDNYPKVTDDDDQSSLRTTPPSSCDDIDLRSLKGKYRIGTFVDGDNGQSYCILATTSILYPWGNVIVDLDAANAKHLSFDIPHPKFDAETGEQGIRMLKGTRARSWIVSGSHRMANNRTYGTCQPQHYPSDAAHSTDTGFLASVAAVQFYYESVVVQDYTSIQLHGMSEASCGSIDTFFSHGSCSDKSGSTNEKVDVLARMAREYPSDHGHHAVVGRESASSICKLCGSTNIQGRLINGVARENLCDSSASSYTGRFVQIEQKREYRKESLAPFWNHVINEAYPKFLALATSTSNTLEQEGKKQ